MKGECGRRREEEMEIEREREKKMRGTREAKLGGDGARERPRERPSDHRQERRD